MVGMGQAFKLFWQRYVDFTGRSTRAEYWWVTLWLVIIYTILIIALAIAGISMIATATSSVTNSSVSSNFIGQMLAAGGVWLFMIFSIIVLFTLAIIIPSLALTVRRFRDAGLKTWAIWTLIGVNWLFSGADSVQNFTSDGRAFSVLSFIISVLMFIISVLATNTLSQMGGIGNGQEDAPVEVAPVSAETTTDSIAEAESESVQSEMTSEINRVEKDNEI